MSVSRRWILALFTVAFLVARVTGAHLHLCLDGSEPLAQLHVSDVSEVDHHHAAEHSLPDPHGAVGADVHSDSHDDVDVDALGNVVAKAAKLDLPVIALLAWCLAFVYVAFVRQSVPAIVRQPEHPPPRYLRPLLRAPPV
jgi:hypothetical protein